MTGAGTDGTADLVAVLAPGRAKGEQSAPGKGEIFRPAWWNLHRPGIVLRAVCDGDLSCAMSCLPSNMDACLYVQCAI